MKTVSPCLILAFVCVEAAAAPAVRSVAPLYSGSRFELSVEGALSGSDVRVFGSFAGVGEGPCAGALCLDLLPPVIDIGAARADDTGSAELVGDAPASFVGLMYLQAVQLAPAEVGSVWPVNIWPRKRVLMIGDSITEGQQSLPAAYPYATVVASLLGEGYDVTQVGCGGATTWDWSSFGGVTLCGGEFWEPSVYEARAIPNLPVDIATVMLGTNDATGFFEPAPIPPADYRLNLIDLVTNLLEDGAARVMLMTPPPMCDSADAATVARLDAYRIIVNAICDADERVVCGPDVYRVLGDEDFQGCDVHPNGIGHLHLGVAVAEAIKGL